ncbi:heme exporter protein CcmD [Citromicrobium bathyomarinum]|jgi:hypothetical protein|uniref:Heme exporter protein CcmD n=1 Tax=Alteriqipengyuania abyssalis TaxID=2860200 RepID=A0ABS7P8V8_9SPHN|nr:MULTISPECIES: heme exporter protein CcmD [Sphingomonadales]MBY8335484.1 heme exporter protein CcmD [Alteriqipengyuania abyssalis]MCD1621536.1 heme exporter protein CcmD [Citromicrobium bathyomarinum]|tara:strand:+ start:2071 stop:2226 length:156 start_codon:yes stop_codon:yes gene_type:complete
MVREALSQWDYVIAAYAIAIPAIAALLIFSWLRMRRAERARDEARQKGRKG